MNFNKIKLFVETNTMDIRFTNDATKVYALWWFFGIKDKLVGILSNGIVLKVNEFNMKWKINSSMKILNMEHGIEYGMKLEYIIPLSNLKRLEVTSKVLEELE